MCLLFQYKPPQLKKKSTPGSRNSLATPTRPPGSSLITQNTNFKNTYVLEETPPSRGLPPKPSSLQKGGVAGGGATITKKAGPVVGSRRQPLNQATPIHRSNDGISQQKPKTTSFSRVKQEITDYSPRTHDSDIDSHTPTIKYTTTRIKKLQNNHASKVSEKPKMSGSSQRLLAALEFSDQSSDEGSGYLNQGDRNSRDRDRHLTQVLNHNGYER